MDPVRIRITGSMRGSLPRVPAVVTNLPPLDTDFTGRATDLAALTEALRDTPVTVVSGLAGVGKTTLALKAAATFNGRALFVDLEAAAALPLVLAGLGVAQEDIPADQAMAEMLYRSLLAESSEPVLLVLDNATSAEQVRPLRPASGWHRVLVTSRHTLADLNARLIELDVLTTDDSIALINAAVQVRRPGDRREPTAELVDLANRLPLALSIVAAVLADDVTMPIDELTALLRPPTERLNELDGVRRAFDLSYTRLTTDQQRLFRLLSIVPVSEFAVELVCSLLEVETRSAQKLLTSLRRAHLLEHGRARGRFRVHDLLQLYSAEQADSERGEAWNRLVEHLAERSDEASAQLDRKALDWLDLEWPLLTKVMERSFELGRYDQIHTLVQCIAQFTRFLDNRQEWLRLLNLGLVSAKVLRDLWLEGMLHGEIGNVHLKLGDSALALACYEECGRVSYELGDTASAIATTFNIANLAWQSGNLARAKKIFKQILKNRTKARAESDAAEAMFRLGCIAREQGKLSEALRRLKAALPVFEASGDLHSAAMALQQIGLVLKHQRRYGLAVPALQKAKRYACESGDLLLEAQTTATIGQVHILSEDFEKALVTLRQAQELFRQVGDEEEAGDLTKVIADLEYVQDK